MASVATGVVRAQSVELTPMKDNTLVQWSPLTGDPNPLLSNGQGDIFVGRSNDDGQEAPTISIRRGLVYFDVAAEVPSGATITGAVLTVRDARGMNGDRTITLHRLLNDWGEGDSYFNGGQATAAENGDATWLHTFYNSSQPSASQFWDTPGGDFISLASAATVISDDFGEGHLFSWSSAGMIADVQAWLDNPGTNLGWLLRGNESAQATAKRFNSRESAAAGSVPVLRVTYIPEPATVMLVGLAGAGLPIGRGRRTKRSR